MKAEEFIDEGKKSRRDKRHTIKPKAPNPVAKHAMSTIGGGGFGAHKDKKKAAKQGDTKHKGKVDEGNVMEYEQHRYKDSQGNVWVVDDEGNKELVSAAPGGSGGGSRYGSRYPRRPAYNKPKGYYFYNVPADQENDARTAGLRQSKSGKWFDTMTNSKAEQLFGKGRYWEPKN